MSLNFDVFAPMRAFISRYFRARIRDRKQVLLVIRVFYWVPSVREYIYNIVGLPVLVRTQYIRVQLRVPGITTVMEHRSKVPFVLDTYTFWKKYFVLSVIWLRSSTGMAWKCMPWSVRAC